MKVMGFVAFELIIGMIQTSQSITGSNGLYCFYFCFPFNSYSFSIFRQIAELIFSSETLAALSSLLQFQP